MSRLTRDGTAEPVSRDQILRHVREQGDIHFPCSADTSRIGNLTRLIHTLLYMMTIHIYICTVRYDRTAAVLFFHILYTVVNSADTRTPRTHREVQVCTAITCYYNVGTAAVSSSLISQ